MPNTFRHLRSYCTTGIIGLSLNSSLVQFQFPYHIGTFLYYAALKAMNCELSLCKALYISNFKSLCTQYDLKQILSKTQPLNGVRS